MKCEHCGSENMALHGCVRCGAPICCQDCCIKTYDKEIIRKDLKRYWQLMMNGSTESCLRIEEKYGLDGLPPNMVTDHLNKLIGDTNGEQ